MKRVIAIGLLTLSFQASIPAALGNPHLDLTPPPPFGTDPGPAVKQWIEYRAAGESNGLRPTIFFAPRRFKTGAAEYLILLPTSKYLMVEQYTRTILAHSDCVLPRAKPIPVNSLGVTVHAKKRTLSCVSEPTNSCPDVTGLLGIENIAWSAYARETIGLFSRSFGCKNR
jgi:hypothetical protein